MTDVTRILSVIEQGDPSAAEQLLPLVYDELRKLAAAKMAQENPGQTLQATGLVHEAYLRLVGSETGRGHRRTDPLNTSLNPSVLRATVSRAVLPFSDRASPAQTAGTDRSR